MELIAPFVAPSEASTVAFSMAGVDLASLTSQTTYLLGPLWDRSKTD